MKTAKDNLVILKELKNLLSKEYADDFKNLILFGSRAEGTAGQDADFDLLIVLKTPVDWRKERAILDLCFEIDLKYEIITDTHILSIQDLNGLRGKQPVFINALSKGIYA